MPDNGLTGTPESASAAAVGRRLRDARRATGLTQKEIADRIGVTRRSIYEWENGIRKPTTALPNLAEVYGVSAVFLLYGPDPSSAEIAALREDFVAVIDELQVVNERVVRLAEAVEEAFREVVRLLALRTDELTSERPPPGNAQDGR